jgi:zinc transporter 1/2/3
MFNNSCIGTLSYEATAPAIALAAAFLTFLLDFFGARHLGRKPPTSPDEDTISPSSSNLATRETKIPHTNLNAPDFMELGHSHHLCSNEEQKWQVAVLEAGIIFHSIMIGVTLGASGGNGWTTLLIVIVFHQFFEGLA